MALFVVIRKPLKSGVILSDTNIPSEKELLKDLQSYPEVYALYSFVGAQQLAKWFFQAPAEPMIAGFYGLIAEVRINFTRPPVPMKVDITTIYNNWVKSQKSSFPKMEQYTRILLQCEIVAPAQVEKILQVIIPESAKAFNPKLEDVKVEAPAASQCLMM